MVKLLPSSIEEITCSFFFLRSKTISAFLFPSDFSLLSFAELATVIDVSLAENIQESNQTRQKALSYAIEKGVLACINSILNAKPTLTYQKGEETALHTATKLTNDINIVKILIENKIDVNAQDPDGKIPKRYTV